MKNVLRLGSRGSRLALIQAEMVRAKLLAHNSKLTIEIVPIQTEGDINKTQPLHEIGGKGVFIKTLEQALVQNKIDAAIHSVKDVTATLEPETSLISFLAPEARTDCLVVSNNQSYTNLKELPLGFSIATSSLRRKAILQEQRPDIIIKDIRGNVQTRIEKCKSGYADGVILSTAGLIRLNMKSDISFELDPVSFIPAAGQGVIGIQVVNCNTNVGELFEAIGCERQKERCFYEHYLVSKVGLDCNYPLGVYVCIKDSIVSMRVCWATLDCKNYFAEHILGDKHSMIQKIDLVIDKIKAVI
jgi:hydroxymethylbilane synthase